MKRCNAIVAVCAATVLGGALLCIPAATRANAEANTAMLDVSTTRLKTGPKTGTKVGRNAIFDRWGNLKSAPAGARSAKGSTKTR